MVRTLCIELTITVNDDEQAAKIFEAVSNGMAEAAIKEKVLYGTQSSVTVPMQQTTVPVDKPREPETKLVSHTKGIPTVTAKEVTATPKERNRGVLGRGRMNRSGGGGVK